MKLTRHQASRLAAAKRGSQVPLGELEEMADRLLAGSSEEHGILTHRQLRHIRSKELPVGQRAIRNCKHLPQVG